MKNHAKVLHFHDIQKYSAKNFIVCSPLLLMNVVRSFITYHINLKKTIILMPFYVLLMKLISSFKDYFNQNWHDIC